MVITVGGTSTHLAFEVFAVRLPGSWPALGFSSGAAGRLKAGLKQGIATITDTNGTLIDLALNTEMNLPEH